MPDVDDRPWEVKASVACMGVLLCGPLIAITARPQDFVPSLLLIPFEVATLYFLYRVFHGDNTLRWVTTAACTCLLAFALYLLYLYTTTVPAYTDVEPLVPNQNTTPEKEGLWKIVLLLLCSAPAILLNLPRANRWFREMNRNRDGWNDDHLE